MGLKERFPHDEGAEIGVVYASMVKPSIIPTVLCHCGPDDFYVDRHRFAFRALVQTWQQEPQFDLVMLGHTIRDDKLTPIKDADAYFDWVMREGDTRGYVPAGAVVHAQNIRASARARRFIGVCENAIYELGKSPMSEDVIRDHLAQLAECAKSDGDGLSVRLSDEELALIDSLQRARPEVYLTGVGALDRLSDGVPRGGVLCVMGYPGGGKSTLALTMAVRLAAQDVPVRVFSYEQSARRIAATLLSAESGLPVHRMINSGENPGLHSVEALNRAAAKHAGYDFRMIERNMAAPDVFNTVMGEARGLSRPGVVVVDYVQDLPPFGRFQELTPKITESMRWLARIARDCGWLVIVVSQLDKAAGKLNRPPDISDGLGSSAIEQRSDMMLSVWRPHQREAPPQRKAVKDLGFDRIDHDYDGWRDRQKLVQFRVLKNKYGGLGMTHAMLELDRLEFREIAPTDRVKIGDSHGE